MIWIGVACLAVVYAWSVHERAKILWGPKFCQFIKGCRRQHRVVIVAPPNKPARVVLKHVRGGKHV